MNWIEFKRVLKLLPEAIGKIFGTILGVSLVSVLFVPVIAILTKFLVRLFLYFWDLI